MSELEITMAFAEMLAMESARLFLAGVRPAQEAVDCADWILSEREKRRTQLKERN